MRKHQQRQILNLLQTIKRAQSLNLYADCRESAAGIGAFIDSIEGKGTQTAKLLTEYCELLSNVGNRMIGKQHLQKHLALIENSVNYELKPPDKIEVAFFPYNASKFDSLESIYLAARSDPQCDAYVVPIPYYNLLPDGKFGQMHYEGDLYPNNIPITDWQEYNVEVRNPDIIFIHTPYDEDNLVTSIHPDFYSKRLKNFTGLLVYVPYFVCIDDVPEYLCVHSGTVYADKIIVQSEKVKQTYIRVFKEFGQENNCEKLFGNLEDKIVALGSPKFDRTLNTKREDCILPDNWRALIEQPDGTRKKVVFYNTSLSSLLQGNETYLKKLQSVLAYFRKRDDVVLWWRPHPLSKNTYQAMRPQLLDEYNQIVSAYKREGYGIYDDTPDLHRAIALSDTYYGDWSSLVAIYLCTEKPIMIQNAKILDTEKYTQAFFHRLYDYGNYWWFTAEFFNALFKIDKETWIPEYVGSFPNVNSREYLYRAITELNGCLYFAPHFADEIIEYDIGNKTFFAIQYKQANIVQNDSRDFCGIAKYGNYLFFTSYMYPAIVRLNAVTKELDYYDDWVEPLKKLIIDENDAFFMYPLVTKESSFMLASCGANAVVEFNMETCRSTIYEIGKPGYRYSGICYDGENYWLSPRYKTPVVKWNPTTGVIHEFADLFKDVFKEYSCYLPIIYNDGFVWLFPRFADKTLRIDINTNEVIISDEFQPCFDDKNRLIPDAYYFAQQMRDSIFAYDGKDGSLIHYNCKTKEKKKKPIVYSPETMKIIQPLIKKESIVKNAADCRNILDCIYYENDYVSLCDFIYLINNCAFENQMCAVRDVQIKLLQKANVHVDGTAGSSIFAYCKQKAGLEKKI